MNPAPRLPAGEGKTSFITSLLPSLPPSLAMAGHRWVLINVSEQSELSDLPGNDLPVPDDDPDEDEDEDELDGDGC